MQFAFSGVMFLLSTKFAQSTKERIHSPRDRNYTPRVFCGVLYYNKKIAEEAIHAVSALKTFLPKEIFFTWYLSNKFLSF
jgi:hypothetical protein